MINFKLHRDQARLIEKFFDYMVEVAVMKVNDSTHEQNEFLTNKILLSIIVGVQNVFKRKLLNTATSFTFKLSEAEGITLYYFLMKQPIDPSAIYVLNLRQHVCDKIHKQIIKPVVPKM